MVYWTGDAVLGLKLSHAEHASYKKVGHFSNNSQGII